MNQDDSMEFETKKRRFLEKVDDIYRGRVIIKETVVQKKKPQMAGERGWISA